MSDLVRGAERGRHRVAGILHLELPEWQPVDEEDDVGAAVLLPDHDPELVDAQEVVALRLLPVDQLHSERALLGVHEQRYLHSLEQELVEVEVVAHRVG